MSRILIVDDHPAMRAGLTAVLRAEPGLVPVGAISGAEELDSALRRGAPDVVLLDYHLPDTDGLVLCRRVKAATPATKVVLYSAYADASLLVPAILAGADGLLNKSVPARELYDALRSVARGERMLPPVTHELLQAAADRLAPEDMPILTMMLDGEPLEEVAETLRVEQGTAGERLDAMLARLRVELPSVS